MGTKPRTINPYDYGFISYDFLKTISPQPEQFELREVLSIPKEDIEARHDYMLSVIKDRVENAAGRWGLVLIYNLQRVGPWHDKIRMY